MSSDRHERVGELFLQASRVPRAQLEAWLDEACAGDDALRAEVRSLLEHDAEGGALSAAGRAVDHDVRELPASGLGRPLPERIGPYRVLSLLGSGGMGAVYEVEQERPRRTVALKVLRPGLATPSMLRRFEWEAEVLGWLEHPGIARIFEAGTADTGSGPQPYFAMELVRGVPLTRFADENRLDVRARLELFAAVCDAVHHAHQKGVIHRDLKPANVLVDATGQPKVLDFGVARAVDSDFRSTTIETQAGQILGTLPYMSPEQVGGDPTAIDTRADVYALGVLAFELLTGRLPVDVLSTPLPQAVHAIAHEEPTRLGTLDRALRGDVETIVAKAVEKDKERRYASALELASDLRRFLSNEPIVARPPSTFYQLQKFARRNRTLVAGVAVAFAALLSGAIVSTRLYVRADAARTAAEDSATAERAAKEDAQRNLVRARAAEERALAEATAAEQVSEFLVDLFEVSDPSDGWTEELTAREMLDAGAQRIEGELASQPRTRARLLDAMGRVYQRLGLFEPSERLLAQALDIRREGDDPAAVVLALANLGETLLRAERYAEAKELLQEALDALGSGPVENVAPGVRPRLVSELSLVALHLGDLARAEELARDALELAEATPGPDPAALSAARAHFALLLLALDRAPEAVEYARANRDATLAAKGPDHPATLKAEASLANLLAADGDYEQSLPILQRIYATRARHLDEGHPERITAANHLGQMHLFAGEYDKAYELFQESLSMTAQRYGEEGPAYAIELHNVGIAAKGLGRFEEAVRVLREATAIMERVDPDHPRLAKSLAQLGLILAEDMQRPDEAEEVLMRAVAIQQDQPTLSPTVLAETLNALQMVHIKHGEFERAEEILNQLLALYLDVEGPEGTSVARTYNNLANLAYRSGRYAEALEYTTQCHDLLLRQLPAGHPTFGYTLMARGKCLTDLGRPAEAEQPLREALALRAETLPEKHPLQAESQVALADCLAALDRFEEAEQHYEQGLELIDELFPAGHPDRPYIHGRMARMYDRWNRPEDARRYRAGFQVAPRAD